MTLVGYPTAVEGSNGGKFNSDSLISISANSAMKEQAWEFCQQMLSEEAQESLSGSLPVRKEAFDKAAAKALEPQTYYDEEGNEKSGFFHRLQRHGRSRNAAPHTGRY